MLLGLGPRDSDSLGGTLTRRMRAGRLGIIRSMPSAGSYKAIVRVKGYDPQFFVPSLARPELNTIGLLEKCAIWSTLIGAGRSCILLVD